jgi:hypothetical protein
MAVDAFGFMSSLHLRVPILVLVNLEVSCGMTIQQRKDIIGEYPKFHFWPLTVGKEQNASSTVASCISLNPP